MHRLLGLHLLLALALLRALATDESLPVYFVNMASQTERRALMLRSLRRYGYNDVTPIQAFVKSDLGKRYRRGAYCTLISDSFRVFYT